MFIFFANCLIFIFLFDETSSKSTEIQHPNPPQFWHQLMQKSGICDEQIKQMASEMDKSDSFIEKLSKEENYKPPRQSPKQPAFEPNQLKHPEKQSLFFNLFKLDNFYELVKGQENAMNFLAEQNEIDYEKAEQIDLPEIVKNMATIWSEMSRPNNGGENYKEIVQKIVNLWQSAKQNDDFKKYFGNKSEGKNRRRKRWVAPTTHDNGSLIVGLIVGGVLIVVSVAIIVAIICCKKM
uniref:Uncharacterized protein n=1 Tax=Globodera rostochiensis TaxID=31243 RepID=A0A914H4K1_GLORO